MDLNPYITTLREDLTAAAAAGDEKTQQVAAVLAAALHPAARLTMMNALSDLAAEITADLDDQVVEVVLDGKDIRVVVTATASGSQDAALDAEEDLPAADGGDLTRITVRLFEELKTKAEEAAAAQGVSLNSFVTQAIQNAVHRHQGRGRGHGYGRRPGWDGSDWWGGQYWYGGRGGRHNGQASRINGWVEG